MKEHQSCRKRITIKMKKIEFSIPYSLGVTSKCCFDNDSHYSLSENPQIRATKLAGIYEREKEVRRVCHVSRGNRHRPLRSLHARSACNYSYWPANLLKSRPHTL